MGRDAQGWVIFCDAENHYIEVTAKTRHQAILRWRKITQHEPVAQPQ